MAAPQRRYRASVATRPVEKKAPPGAAPRKKAVGRRRRFAVIVVVPMLLMLGSVYLHTVAAGLAGKVVGLEQRLARVEAEGERLEVRVAELSGAGRIRSLAAEKLDMQDPKGADLEVYSNDREDGTRNGGEEKGGEPRHYPGRRP
jgi:cell division protein FtsL